MLGKSTLSLVIWVRNLQPFAFGVTPSKSSRPRATIITLGAIGVFANIFAFVLF